MISITDKKLKTWFIFKIITNISDSNRPFAGSSHMVRNKLHWDANDAVGLPKQRNSYQSSPTFLCFESPTASFASQCNLFRTM